MFKEMRKKDREITVTEAMEILKSCDYGILSTVGENRYPYGVPVSYVYTNDSIYFHSTTEGYKLDNLKNNDKVSFCTVGQTCVLPDKFSTKYESVIVFGRANEVYDNEKNTALLEILKKYSPNYMEKGRAYIENSSNRVKVIKINIEHISGKARR